MKLKKKSIAVITIVFIVMSLQPLPVDHVFAASEVSISAVQAGSNNNSSFIVGPSSNLIGHQVSVDIRIDNTGPIWGWYLSSVTWNSGVLNLTSVQERDFLTNNTTGSASFAGNSKSLWNNTQGLIYGGLAEAFSSADTSVDTSGVLVTLTFVIVGYGSSPITIAGGNVRASSIDHTGTNVTCNSATVTIANNPPNTNLPSNMPSNSTPEFQSWTSLSIIIALTVWSLAVSIIRRKTNKQ